MNRELDEGEFFGTLHTSYLSKHRMSTHDKILITFYIFVLCYYIISSETNQKPNFKKRSRQFVCLPWHSSHRKYGFIHDWGLYHISFAVCNNRYFDLRRQASLYLPESDWRVLRVRSCRWLHKPKCYDGRVKLNGFCSSSFYLSVCQQKLLVCYTCDSIDHSKMIVYGL